MNTLRLLICLAGIAATQFVFADQVNHCKDSYGRVTMTERPCGDPATERNQRQPPQIAVDQIQAEDIFRARALSREGRPPASPELIDSRGIPQDPGTSGASR
ncbi:hypothetical protein AB4Z46_28015 [Variovorax sp. M-6]|uniref:hypothetical protein n=1 Tax=Variovorax sp. M-6 TaxID=3233041 RepID=UPI003F9D8705